MTTDGPISIPNTRYYRYQGLEEKYRVLARNIDYFDTAKSAIFLIVVSRLIVKMIVMVMVVRNLTNHFLKFSNSSDQFLKILKSSLNVHNFLFVGLSECSRRYSILNILRNSSEKLLKLEEMNRSNFFETLLFPRL